MSVPYEPSHDCRLASYMALWGGEPCKVKFRYHWLMNSPQNGFTHTRTNTHARECARVCMYMYNTVAYIPFHIVLRRHVITLKVYEILFCLWHWPRIQWNWILGLLSCGIWRWQSGRRLRGGCCLLMNDGMSRLYGNRLWEEEISYDILYNFSIFWNPPVTHFNYTSILHLGI